MKSEQLNVFIRKRNDDNIEFQTLINFNEKVKKIKKEIDKRISVGVSNINVFFSDRIIESDSEIGKHIGKVSNIVLEYETISKRRLRFKRSRSKSVENDLDDYSNLACNEKTKNERKYSDNSSFIKKKKRNRSESLYPVSELEDGEIDEIEVKKKKTVKSLFTADFSSITEVQEINKLLDDIKLNDENKEIIREIIINNVPKITNKREIINDISFLKFHLNKIDINAIKDKNPEFKINLILDIDSTIICAESLDRYENLWEYKNMDKEEVYTIEYFEPALKNEYLLKFKIRKHVLEFLKNISSLCNIYISTHSQISYAKEVIKIISQKSEIEILLENIHARKPEDLCSQTLTNKNLRIFSLDEEFKKYSIIMDDTPIAWEMEYIGNIIQSMKYISFFNNKHFDEKSLSRLGRFSSNYIFHTSDTIKRIDCFDIKDKYLDENSSPYSLEYEYSKKFQIEYMTELIHNIYKIIFLTKSDVVSAIKIIKKSILNGCRFNLEYYYDEDRKTDDLVSDMIQSVGGKIVKDDATHYIVSKYRVSDYDKKKNKLKNSYAVNLKWLFHCYFFYTKMDENDIDYKL